MNLYTAATITFKSGSVVTGKVIATATDFVNIPVDANKLYFPTAPGQSLVLQSTANCTFRLYVIEFSEIQLG